MNFMLRGIHMFFWWGSFYFTLVHAQGTFNGSQLIWGDLTNTQSTAISGARDYIFSTALTSAQTLGTAVAVLDGSGPANTATARLPTLLNIALCAVVKPDPTCFASAIQGLTVWAPLYKPTGNAGNEYNFVSWLQAYDLMRPYLILNGTYNSTVVLLDNFTYSFISALDSQYGSTPDAYRTQRLLVRAFASLVLRNSTEINNSMTYIESHGKTNMFSDGTTYDYRYHDSLAWHLKTLGYWIQLVLQAPFMCSTNTLRLLEGCTNFLQQFVNTSVIHQEYQNSQSSSDNTAKAQNLSWVNSTSYSYLMQADIVYNSTYTWDQSITRSWFSIQQWLQTTLRWYYTSYPLYGRITTTTVPTSTVTTTTVPTSTVTTTTVPTRT